MHTVAFCEMKKQTSEDEDGHFFCEQKHPIHNPTAQPQCSTSLHTSWKSYIPSNSSPNELGQVTFVAKKPDSPTQLNSSVNAG
jgi:hypothetical protein